MLLQLNICNFALIEKLTINFEKGFNVLTGETGAGKSILIDAINYVLGGKFSKNIIRNGTDRTYVEAIFTIENPMTIEELRKNEIEFDDMLIISREYFQSGRSIAKVNGKTILVSQLKSISESVLDIHGQHQNQTLLDNSMHINYLDFYGKDKIQTLLEPFITKFDKYNEIENKIKELSLNKGGDNKLLDFLKYQIEEIDKAKLKIGEDIELEERYSLLNNSENIESVLSSCYEKLYEGNDNEKSVYDNLNQVIKEIRSIEKNVPTLEKLADSFEDFYYNLEQSIEEIRNIKSNISFDPQELDYINNRIFKIEGYKKKYGKTIEEIIKYKEKIQSQYEEIINSEEIICKLTLKKNNLRIELVQDAKKIHERRFQIADDLSKKVKKELDYIGMEKSIFKINDVFEENCLSSKGCDKVQFLIATNPGQELQPLDKIVSGGELSRIMLALKSVFVDEDYIPSVIFDEIDTGISGRIAQSVGEKMYDISMKHQVFCITHLPQIASLSDNHYLVSKEVENKNTYTKIKKLTEDEKNYEIAKMMGGSEVTKLTIENAKEIIMLANAKKLKSK